MSPEPISLGASYTAEFDEIGESEWNQVVRRFADASIYQAWAYDSIRCGDERLSHCVVRRNGEIVSVAQARLATIPFIGIGAAYVRWGPLWRLRNEIPDADVLQNAVRALRNEYVCRRGLMLRLFPSLYSDDAAGHHDALVDEGYASVRERPGRTLIVDLAPNLEGIRRHLDRKWRNCLKNAEQPGFTVSQGTGDEIFRKFIDIYDELLQRKKFKEPNSLMHFRRIQQELPDDFKMQVFICRDGGAPAAGGVFSAVGDTGLYLFGATNSRGLTSRASYLIQWKAIEWMKSSGCRYYNLNGINPLKNPGTYRFKAGLAKANGRDVYYLGRFDCHSRLVYSGLARAAGIVMPVWNILDLF